MVPMKLEPCDSPEKTSVDDGKVFHHMPQGKITSRGGLRRCQTLERTPTSELSRSGTPGEYERGQRGRGRSRGGRARVVNTQARPRRSQSGRGRVGRGQSHPERSQSERGRAARGSGHPQRSQSGRGLAGRGSGHPRRGRGARGRGSRGRGSAQRRPGFNPVPPMPLLLRCSRCPAKLNSKDNLRKHELIHDGAKPIYCNRCEERFMNCAELQVHYQQHAEEQGDKAGPDVNNNPLGMCVSSVQSTSIASYRKPAPSQPRVKPKSSPISHGAATREQREVSGSEQDSLPMGSASKDNIPLPPSSAICPPPEIPPPTATPIISIKPIHDLVCTQIGESVGSSNEEVCGDALQATCKEEPVDRHICDVTILPESAESSDKLLIGDVTSAENTASLDRAICDTTVLLDNAASRERHVCDVTIAPEPAASHERHVCDVTIAPEPAASPEHRTCDVTMLLENVASLNRHVCDVTILPENAESPEHRMCGVAILPENVSSPERRLWRSRFLPVVVLKQEPLERAHYNISGSAQNLDKPNSGARLASSLCQSKSKQSFGTASSDLETLSEANMIILRSSSCNGEGNRGVPELDDSPGSNESAGIDSERSIDEAIVPAEDPKEAAVGLMESDVDSAPVDSETGHSDSVANSKSSEGDLPEQQLSSGINQSDQRGKLIPRQKGQRTGCPNQKKQAARRRKDGSSQKKQALLTGVEVSQRLKLLIKRSSASSQKKRGSVRQKGHSRQKKKTLGRDTRASSQRRLAGPRRSRPSRRKQGAPVRDKITLGRKTTQPSAGSSKRKQPANFRRRRSLSSNRSKQRKSGQGSEALHGITRSSSDSAENDSEKTSTSTVGRRRRRRTKKASAGVPSPAGTLPCSRCDVKLSSAENVRKHELTHDGAKPFFCERCDSRYMSAHALRLHENTHTNARPYACDQCEKSYNDPSVLQRHKQGVHLGIRHECKICGEKYQQKAGLLHHVRRRHIPTQRWPCAVCTKVFPLEVYRNKHMESHVKVAPEDMLPCPQCGKRFKRQSCLKSHLFRHSGQKPFPCGVCGRPFAEAGQRGVHERTHRSYDQRPFQCTTCHKRFVQHGALTRHLRTHTGERPFGCAVCTARFGDLSALIVHRRVHVEGHVDRRKTRHKKEPTAKQKRRNKSQKKSHAWTVDYSNTTAAPSSTESRSKKVLKPEAPARKQPPRCKRVKTEPPDSEVTAWTSSLYYEDPRSDDEELEELVMGGHFMAPGLRIGLVAGCEQQELGESDVIERVRPGLAGLRLKRRRVETAPQFTQSTDAELVGKVEDADVKLTGSPDWEDAEQTYNFEELECKLLIKVEDAAGEDLFDSSAGSHPESVF